MPGIGFLHTSPVHVTTFDRLVHGRWREVAVRHVVDEHLLAAARNEGPESTAATVAEHLRRLRAEGAEVVVCTCSTIGDVAERAAAGVPVVRVDRPTARLAVTHRRIGVLATLASTLAPTRLLLDSEARRLGTEPVIEVRLVPGAWDAFEAGDEESHLGLVAEAARAWATDVDVVVLAQASMAPAALRLAEIGVPVLASPGPAVEYAVARLAGVEVRPPVT